jgi:hypothetical protein
VGTNTGEERTCVIERKPRYWLGIRNLHNGKGYYGVSWLRIWFGEKREDFKLSETVNQIM